VSDVLCSQWTDHLPGLGVVIQEEVGGRLFVRGTVIVDIDHGASKVGTFDRVDGGQLHTWIELVIAECREIRLAVGNEVAFDGTLYSASFGVLPAVGVELMWIEPELGSDLSAEEGPVDSVDVKDLEPIGSVMDKAQLETDLDTDEVPFPENAPARSALDEPAAQDEFPIGQPKEAALQRGSTTPETILGTDAYLEPPMESIPSSRLSSEGSASMISPVDGLSMTGNYDDLFGATQLRSVEGAAVRPVDQDAEAEAAMNAEAGAGQTEQSQGEYDSIHDGRTLTSAQLRKLRGEKATSPPRVAMGTLTDVLAVMCREGHPNAPHDVRCRQCGAQIEEQEPKLMRRPPLGRFIFSTGEVVTIDSTLLIGRSPKANGPLVDGHTPELVQLESPDKDISRTHLEVRVEGWQVFAVDQNSANGTVVLLPGRSEQRLRANEPFLLTIGARVRLADEIEFSMEALA
jgi:hypothetical protein